MLSLNNVAKEKKPFLYNLSQATATDENEAERTASDQTVSGQSNDYCVRNTWKCTSSISQLNQTVYNLPGRCSPNLKLKNITRT